MDGDKKTSPLCLSVHVSHCVDPAVSVPSTRENFFATVARGEGKTFLLLVNGVDEYLKIKLDEIRKYRPEIEYIERNVQPDHDHIVVSLRQSTASPSWYS